MSTIGPESPHRRHNTTNLPKTHQVHTCIHSHMRPPPKNHNLVPAWPFYKPFFLFESPFCVEYLPLHNRQHDLLAPPPVHNMASCHVMPIATTRMKNTLIEFPKHAMFLITTSPMLQVSIESLFRHLIGNFLELQHSSTSPKRVPLIALLKLNLSLICCQ